MRFSRRELLGQLLGAGGLGALATLPAAARAGTLPRRELGRTGLRVSAVGFEHRSRGHLLSFEGIATAIIGTKNATQALENFALANARPLPGRALRRVARTRKGFAGS